MRHTEANHERDDVTVNIDTIDMIALARSLAVRHNLVCNDGCIVCWECRRDRALLPSLHCPRCLTAAWNRAGIISPRCEQREQTEEDMRLMAPNQETENG